MSRELMEVKEDNFKARMKDIIIISVIIILGVIILVGSFVISYNAKKDRAESVSDVNLVDDFEDEDIKLSDENSANDAEDDKEVVENKNNKKDAKSLKNQKEEIKKVNLPVWNDTAVEDIKSIYGSDEKQVYLTFDDGPSQEITPRILQILKSENVPATFFVLGKCVDAYPELVKQEYEDGHFIANHGYTHTYSQIYASIDNVINEYNRTNESIRNAIGNQEYDPHLFRFPGGSSGGPYNSLKAEAKQYLADNNVASTNWNCLTSDAAGNNSVASQYNGVLETQGSNTSLIILMHDAGDKKYTPDTLKLIIQYYKDNGYEFKNFYEIFKEKEIEEPEETEVEEQEEEHEIVNIEKTNKKER